MNPDVLRHLWAIANAAKQQAAKFPNLTDKEMHEALAALAAWEKEMYAAMAMDVGENEG